MIINIKTAWSPKIGEYYYVDADGNISSAKSNVIGLFRSQKEWNATFYHVLHAVINNALKKLANNETDLKFGNIPDDEYNERATICTRAWCNKKVILTCYDEPIYQQVLNIIAENKDGELEVSAEYREICPHKENNIIDFRLDDIYDAFNSYFNCTIELVR